MNNLLPIYKVLVSAHGNQNWWPADTPFEVIIGAILTQSVSWTNVEKCIKNLHDEGLVNQDELHKKEVDEIASLIKSSRFYNEKAKKIKNFLDFLFDRYEGNLSIMSMEELPILRELLLNIKGLGQETVDSILLYACNKPVFVVDAYTKRIFSRYGLVNENASYRDIQRFFMENLPQDIELFNDYHAQIVYLGKNICKTQPECKRCPIKKINKTKCRYIQKYHPDIG
jgi:endonuclease III related protein